ncbi:PREDICTED: disintegrin and metalloproteinase domain-containing protein 30-like [Chrysochloris asiatica]|uniref:Disintegrin and metalloproteinase domain-containing protein 30-like n=1 Tax=Chrysochloris asiatica TaxID=185453 RepID=A0A9B0WL87_CHRAS|nr:PREDICTED: disintegrin and metalloproteinase domain-containing protein 30-like [Chrysochloris asiatica]
MASERTSLCPGCRLLGLVLAMLLVESRGEDIILHPDWGFDSYEITIPKKLSFRAEEQGVAGHEAYLLKVKGKKHVLHLRPKRFLLPRHLRVFSFTDQGDVVEDHPYIPNVCNYLGSVEESEESEATLSTCIGGLRGILKINEELYQIEPLKDSSTFEHVIYFLNKDHFSNWTCGLTNEQLKLQMAQHEDMARIRDFPGTYKHQKYMELFLLFDYNRYLFVKSNATQVISDAILLTGIMDTYVQELDMRINILGLEIWTRGDRINTKVHTLSIVMGHFISYRFHDINKRIRADWAHLYLQKIYPDSYGWSFGGVCTQGYSGSIVSFPNQNILAPGTWSVHEFGHSFSIGHDWEYCQCKGKTSCIMGTGRTGWSNCSFTQYFQTINIGISCLNNIPQISYVLKSCGNSIVEVGEECDCGTIADCRKDKCCQPDCKLKPGANCSIGLCCHECQFRPSGYVCRQQENECDLEEYCSGTASHCPADTYKQDGTPCKYEAHCYSKGCRSRVMQCQNIFGPDAKDAPTQCYNAVNMMGDQYGNCEITKVAVFKSCDLKNSLCGRLQCINVQMVPDMPDHSLIINTHLKKENLLCWGTGYHLGMRPMGIPDSGVINDGTPCGKNKICLNRSCVPFSDLKYDCLPEKCNNRGICNNRKHCHCMYGWAPPFCEEEGYGGSIDSGPPGPLDVEVVPSSVQIVFIIFLRLIFLIVSIIAVFFIQGKLKKKETSWNIIEDDTSKVT